MIYKKILENTILSLRVTRPFSYNPAKKSTQTIFCKKAINFNLGRWQVILLYIPRSSWRINRQLSVL